MVPAARRLATDRARDLLVDPDAAELVGDGYLDLLGERTAQRTGLAQALMMTRLLPEVYERWWRPGFGRLLEGLAGPGMGGEKRLARELLDPAPGAVMLDVACGPGNFSRDFAQEVGAGGLVVGIDASATMLARAVTERDPGNVAYVRGDAVALPFVSGSFDAVCCFAALHMFADPWTALGHMARVLRPGGRIALLTSVRAPGGPRRQLDGLAGRVSGQRMFERGEVLAALSDRGFSAVSQRVSGVAQFVGAVRR